MRKYSSEMALNLSRKDWEYPIFGGVQISVRLSNLLKKHSILSLKDLNNTDCYDFARYDGVGKITAVEFTELYGKLIGHFDYGDTLVSNA